MCVSLLIDLDEDPLDLSMQPLDPDLTIPDMDTNMDTMHDSSTEQDGTGL